VSCRYQSNFAIQSISNYEPGNQSTHEADHRGCIGSEGILLAPGQGEGDGDHSRSDDDAHEQVQVAQSDAEIVEH